MSIKSKITRSGIGGGGIGMKRTNSAPSLDIQDMKMKITTTGTGTEKNEMSSEQVVLKDMEYLKNRRNSLPVHKNLEFIKDFEKNDKERRKSNSCGNNNDTSVLVSGSCESESGKNKMNGKIHELGFINVRNMVESFQKNKEMKSDLEKCNKMLFEKIKDLKNELKKKNESVELVNEKIVNVYKERNEKLQQEITKLRQTQIEEKKKYEERCLYFFNEGIEINDLKKQNELLVHEIIGMKKDKDKYKNSFRSTRKENKKLYKKMSKMKSSVKNMKAEVEKMSLDNRVRINKNQLNLHFSDTNMLEAVQNTRKDLSQTILRDLRTELRNIKNLKIFISTMFKRFSREISIFQSKFKEIIPKIEKLNFNNDKKDMDYSSIQLRIIKDLGLLNFYDGSAKKKSKGKDGLLHFKTMFNWRLQYVVISRKHFSISFYQTSRKAKLLFRHCLEDFELVDGDNNTFLLKIPQHNSIVLKANSQQSKLGWVEFLNGLLT